MKMGIIWHDYYNWKGVILLYRKITIIQDGLDVKATLESSPSLPDFDGTISEKSYSYSLEEFFRSAIRSINKLTKDNSVNFVKIKCKEYRCGDTVIIKKHIDNVRDDFRKYLGSAMTIKSTSATNDYYCTVEDENFMIKYDDIDGKVICCNGAVHRKALPGEYVVVKENPPMSPYDIGDIKKVRDVLESGYIRYGIRFNQKLHYGQYDVLDGYNPAHNGISVGDRVTIEKETVGYYLYSDCSLLGEYKSHFVENSRLPKRDTVTEFKVVAIGYDDRDYIPSKIIRDLAVIQDPMTTQVFIVNASDIERVDDK